MILGNSSRSMSGDGPASPKYSDKLSPAISNYLSQASRQEPQRTPDNGNLWQRVNSQLSSPSQPYSLREALAQSQSSRIGTSALALRESLHPVLRQKLSSFCHFLRTSRLRAVLTITVSELISDVQVTQIKPDGTLEESGEARGLKKSLEELADESKSPLLLAECGIPEKSLVAKAESGTEDRWSWSEVKHLSESLIMALDPSLEHAILDSVMNIDRYAAAESFHKLAVAFAPVPDLHIMWLLHLCDAHQEIQSWAEAAQCAVAVAGIVMQALVSRNDGVWSREHVVSLRKICPMVSSDVSSETSAAEVEGYGASKLTIDSAVKYLQLANKLFSQAELYHFCASILELVIPVYKGRKAYGQLAKCHTMLTNIYKSILEQESSPIPFIDATFYRVGFYGDEFGKLDKKEYVYREQCDVRLGDMMQKVTRIYE
ncbi:hypothetical protein Droror1_Dr00022865 [Drosera rotundifolia]